MIRLSYDLHIHTCLSPCGDRQMIPDNIIGMAYMNNLDVIAITDHNTTKNCEAVYNRGKDFGIIVIPGIEVTTSEDIHVVVLFKTLEDANKFNTYIYEHLAKVANKEKVFGEQLFCNYKNEIIGKEKYLLINATDISIEDMYEICENFSGLMIPAHIDRDSYSILSILGTIPNDSKFKCVEIKNKKNMPLLLEKFPYLKQCTILHNSDAHYLTEINESNDYIEVKEKNIDEIFKKLYENK